jgi:Carbohydrate binding domain
MPIKINSTGGGSVSIDVPSTGGTYTLTAPANNATIFTTAGGAITGNVAFTGANVSINGQSIAPSYGMKNRIINGDFKIWQRGTSSSSPGSLIADRWYISTGTTVTGSQSSDVPSGFKYSLSISGTNYPQSYQRIESLNCVDLVGKSITISFWAKQTSGAGSASLALAIYTADSTDNFSSATGINNATFTGTTGWVQYSTTFTNLPANTVNGLQVLIYANTTGAATFLFTGFQLEAGTVATPFEFRHYGQELALCQRYYETGGDSGGGVQWSGNATSGAAYYATIPFKVTKRATPTVTPTSINNYGFPSTASTVYMTAGVLSECRFTRTSNSSVNGGYFGDTWTASAEL